MVKVTVCIGSSCHLKGSRLIVEELQRQVTAHGLKDKVDLAGQFCMGNCQNGVCVTLGETAYSLRPEDVARFFAEHVLPAVG